MPKKEQSNDEEINRRKLILKDFIRLHKLVCKEQGIVNAGYTYLNRLVENIETQTKKDNAKEIFKDLESKFTNKITDTIMWKKLKKKWLK